MNEAEFRRRRARMVQTVRRTVPLLLAAALILAVGVAIQARHAVAQEPVEVTFVVETSVDPNSSGYAFVDAGEVDGILAVGCTGNRPQGGTSQIPSQVLTDVQAARTQLRIVNPHGAVVSAPVVVNCTVDLLVPTTAQAQQVRQQFAG